MKKLVLNRIMPAIFGVILLGLTVFAVSSCSNYYSLGCEVQCDDLYPYWGGDTDCYASEYECEQYWTICYDCSD